MKLSAITLAAVLAACSATPPPAAQAVATSVASPNAMFGKYHTFSFGLADQPKQGYAVTPRSLEVQRRLHTVVLNALTARGYTETDARGDFVVKLASGTGEAPNPSAEHAVSTQAQGFIGIDVYDAQSGTMVWQGSAFAEIDMDKIDDALLQRGVDHMLADFPPEMGTATAAAK